MERIKHKISPFFIVLMLYCSFSQLKATVFTCNHPSDSIIFDTVYDVVHSYKISVGLSAGPGFSNFHYKHNPNDKAYIDKLKNSTTPRYGYTINGSILLSRDRLFLKTGLGYTYFRSDFKYSTQKFNIKDVKYTTSQLIDQYYITTDDGRIDTIDVTQDIELTRKDTSIQTFTEPNNNRLSYFELPVYIGYSFPGDKFSLHTYIGIIPGILHQSDQEIIDYDNENQTYKLSKNNNEIRKFLLSFSGGVGASYKINPVWSANLQCMYRQSLSSMYTENPEISKHNSSLFFSLGVCYFINEFFR